MSLCRTHSTRQKSAAGVARHRPGERETIGSVAARALTEDSVEMEFLTDDPVAQAVTCQRVTFDARAPRCGRSVCATAGRVNWT
jgi:catabolite regulation protein CreA